MSIFTEHLQYDLIKVIENKQKLLSKENRNENDIKYLYQNNIWVKVFSFVDFKEGDRYTNKFALNNILRGSLISNNKKHRYGINNKNSLYSNKNFNNNINRNGIKPIPGITNITVSYLGDKGSLRDIKVDFKVWDVKQLNIMEKLYLRPGYQILVEWGWNIFLDDNNNIKQVKSLKNIEDYTSNYSLDSIYKEILKNREINKYHYDGGIGTIYNYSIKSNKISGGWDCSFNIKTPSEITESLKINYSLIPNISKNNNKSIWTGNIISDLNIKEDITNEMKNYNIFLLKEYYEENILKGLSHELYLLGLSLNKPNELINISNNKYDNNYNIIYIPEISPYYNDDEKEIVPSSKYGKNGGVYIDLKSLLNIINDYINIKDINNNKILDLSLENFKGEDLRCIGNSLQISVDPSVCLINNPQFGDFIPNIKVDNDIEIEKNRKKLIEEEIEKYKDKDYYGVINNYIFSSKRIGQDYYGEEDINIKRINNFLNFIYNHKNYNYKELLNLIFLLSEKNLFYYNKDKNIKDCFLDSTTKYLYNYETIEKKYIQNYFNNFFNNFEEEIKNKLKLKYSENYGRDSLILGTEEFIYNKNKNIFKKDYDYEKDFKNFIKKYNTFNDYEVFYSRVELINNIIKSIIKENKDKYNFYKDVLDYQSNIFIRIKNKLSQYEKFENETTEMYNNINIFKTLSQNYKKILSPLPIYLENKSNNDYLIFNGILKNIFINVDIISLLSSREDLKDKHPNQDNNLSLGIFLRALMKEINNSIGRINNFKIHIDPDDGKVRIIDDNYVYKEIPSLLKEKTYRLDINNNKSIFYDFNIESNIFSEYSSMIAINASLGNDNKFNSNKSPYNVWGDDIKNRLIQNLSYPTEHNNDNNEKLIQKYSSLLSNLVDFLKFDKIKDEEKTKEKLKEQENKDNKQIDKFECK